MFVVLAAHFYLANHVFITASLAFFIDVDHRAVDVEHRDHFLHRLVHFQCVHFAGPLMDKSALFRDPGMREITPAALEPVSAETPLRRRYRQDDPSTSSAYGRLWVGCGTDHPAAPGSGEVRSGPAQQRSIALYQGYTRWRATWSAGRLRGPRWPHGRWSRHRRNRTECCLLGNSAARRIGASRPPRATLRAPA